VGRDELVSRLWPQSSLDDGRHCLRQGLYRLRHMGFPVRVEDGWIVLAAPRDGLDLHILLHDSLARPQLVQLGLSSFLPSYVPALGEPYGHWVDWLRAQVATRLRRALCEELTEARRCGRFHEMGQLSRAVLALDPLNELATSGLAESIALEGSKVEAVRLLDEYEEEVGSISPELRLPVRVLRRRVSEHLDDSLLLRRFEVPFVGREREFEELRSVLRSVRGGAAGGVILSGEAGVGKSRLANEVLRLAALDGATHTRYTTSAGDTFTPISTLVTLGQLLLRLPGALGCAQEHLTYVRRLGTPDTVFTWSMAGLAADILYAQLVQSFAELISAIADEAPLILFLDDAERLHPTTWRVLVDVWDRVSSRRVLFLLAARHLPEWFGSLGARSCERQTRHVRLFPFGRDESQLFLRHWSAKNQVPIDGACAEQVVATARGNAFYLTELAAHLGRGGDPTTTPASIRELIAAQQEALSRGAQRLLLVIALLEARATTSRVSRVLEVPAAEVMAGLEELEVSGLVVSLGPAVSCRHRLVGEVASQLTRPGLLAFTHVRVAALLEEEADATDSVELLGDCVTHWERGGETKRAYEAAMKLGHRLVGMGMGEEAEKAFVRAEGIAESRQDKVHAVEGRMIACQLAARWIDILTLAEKRSEIGRLGRPRRRRFNDFEILVAEASLFASAMSPDTDRLFRIADQQRVSEGTRIRALVLASIVADNCFDGELLSRAYETGERIGANSPPSLEITLLRAIFHSTLGDRELGKHLSFALADLARQTPDYSSRLLGMRRAAEAALRVGDPGFAFTCTIEALELSRALKLPVQEADSLEKLVQICLAQDQQDQAAPYLDRLNALEAESPDRLTKHRLLASTLLAWYGRDPSRAASIRDLARSVPATSIPRAEQMRLSIIEALEIIGGSRDFDRHRIDQLLKLHDRGARFCGQDFASDVLVSAVLKSEGARDAERIRARYIRDARRERHPVPKGLRSLRTIFNASPLNAFNQ